MSKIRLISLQRFQRNYSTSIGRSEQWRSVVGLEIHAQIATKSKLFSRSPNEFASPVNANVSLFDCSTPGTLPVLNKKCVEAAVFTALALNCNVNPISMFDRKHYFYADMPSGYQITQQRSPIASKGLLSFDVHVSTKDTKNKPTKKISARIKQIQLEQDSGKSLHGEDYSLVDLNRAGAPLMELVFEPDLTDGEEAAALVKELCIILQRIGTCSCKMEEGALRIDANVSVHKPKQPYGTRTEIKNIGSIRGVAGAIQYEIQRQIKVLDNGGSISNETRAWDANSKSTVSMRDKEVEQDYRYMPEPNLPPLHVAVGPIQQGIVNVEELRSKLPEMPDETRCKLVNDFGLSIEQAIILVNEPKLYDNFMAVLTENSKFKAVANFIINDLLTAINKEKLTLETAKVDVNFLKEMLQLKDDSVISHNTVKVLLKEMLSGNKKTPKQIVEDNSLGQINDVETITKLCQEVLAVNQNIVKQYKNGKTKVFKALLGIVYKETNQRANMALVSDVLKKLLSQ